MQKLYFYPMTPFSSRVSENCFEKSLDGCCCCCPVAVRRLDNNSGQLMVARRGVRTEFQFRFELGGRPASSHRELMRDDPEKTQRPRASGRPRVKTERSERLTSTRDAARDVCSRLSFSRSCHTRASTVSNDGWPRFLFLFLTTKLRPRWDGGRSVWDISGGSDE